MDQVKIGKFISLKRKERNITQSELAEMLNITDRAISKWENGVCLPDASNVPNLCKILDISINDLFSGEVVDMKDNEKKLEENLLEMTRIKEQRDKELLAMEIFIGIIVSIIMLVCIFLASFVSMQDWLRIILIIIGIIPFAIGTCYAIRIEQIAGYYECNNCHYKYVPTYKSVLFSMHINRTRKMKCPKCNKKTWHRKVLSK
ncbi:MAG: helix-turn-helix transcriptional regulator [Bacilli bacterium]|nr:helix-turn-helix transcriptional regulator [Bacilli bacterium]